MNFIYVCIYLVICVMLFLIIFMEDKTFEFFVEKQTNGITDYNDPKYTGGFHYVFNPLRNFTSSII